MPRRTFCFTFFNLRALPEKFSVKEKQNVLLGGVYPAPSFALVRGADARVTKRICNIAFSQRRDLEKQTSVNWGLLFYYFYSFESGDSCGYWVSDAIFSFAGAASSLIGTLQFGQLPACSDT